MIVDDESNPTPLSWWRLSVCAEADLGATLQWPLMEPWSYALTNEQTANGNLKTETHLCWRRPPEPVLSPCLLSPDILKCSWSSRTRCCPEELRPSLTYSEDAAVDVQNYCVCDCKAVLAALCHVFHYRRRSRMIYFAHSRTRMTPQLQSLSLSGPFDSDPAARRSHCRLYREVRLSDPRQRPNSPGSSAADPGTTCLFCFRWRPTEEESWLKHLYFRSY